MKISLVLLLFGGVLQSMMPDVGAIAKGELAKPNPLNTPYAPAQNTVIQTQNAYNFDRDLTAELIDRNKRGFLLDNIKKLLSDMEKQKEKINQDFEDKMGKINALLDKK